MSSISDKPLPSKTTSGNSLVKELEQLRKYFPENSGAYPPAIFPLGYFIRRNEPRLLYVMPLTMTYEGKPYQVKSKNISVSGIQIYMPRTFIIEGKIVQLSFNQFIEEQNSILGGVDEFTNFENIDYLVKEVQHTEQKTYISLVQKNLPAATMDFFQRYINGKRLRYKIDATDRIYASKAQYYENLYTINMQHVPVFVRWNKTYGLHIDTIVKTEGNALFFDYLNNNRGFSDFRALCLPKRIEKFAEMARQNQSALLFSYWEQGRFHSLFDFELQSDNDFTHMLIKVASRKGRIFKASTNLNKKPAADKITAMLSRIQKIDVIASQDIDTRASESIAQVIFTDVTKVFSRQEYFLRPLKFTTGESLSISVLRDNEQVRMADGHILQTYDNAIFHTPEVINFGIGHNRYDPRYQYEMDVSVKANNQVYAAKTVDFSRSGLGMVIKQPAQIDKDCEIEITFSSLMIKGISTQLKDIPHRVMIARENENGLFLGVIRNSSACHPDVNRFFIRLVKKNHAKLELCIKDKIDCVNTTFYEAFVTENIQTIPIVITRDRNEHRYIREVGLNDTPCDLAEKLYIKGHGYDFRFLTTELRLNELHQRALKASAKNSQSFMLYFFKGQDELGKETVFSVTDFELILEEQIEQIIKIVLERNGACVRVQFINNLLIDKLYQIMTLDKVEKLNKSSARILAQEYKEIIGFAEMLDLTDEYRKQYQFINH